MTKERTEAKIDKAVDLSFPASDPTAHGNATSTEPPSRPTDREAPVITKEQIDQAQRGEGHKHQDGSMGSNSKPVDRPNQETVEVRQGTGPRAMVSVLTMSLVLAGIVGVALLTYYTGTY
jgi:hypothetical protein